MNLLHADNSTVLLEESNELLSLILTNILLEELRARLDELLSLLKTLTSDSTDFLNNLDLILSIERLELEGEVSLGSSSRSSRLSSSSSGSSSGSGSSRGSGHESSVGVAESGLEGLDKLKGLHDVELHDAVHNSLDLRRRGLNKEG